MNFQIINSITGIDILRDDTEEIPHPTIILDMIYKAGGRKKGYSKNEYVVKNVIGKLDFGHLYLTVRNRNKSLNELLTCLDGLIP